MLGDDIGGIAVHIASRILARAAPGEVLLPRTLRDLVAGSDLAFTDRGDPVLKGLAEPWRLPAVVRWTDVPSRLSKAAPRRPKGALVVVLTTRPAPQVPSLTSLADPRSRSR